jgi:hypothetical protein
MPPSAANQAFNSAAAVLFVTIGAWMAAVVYEHVLRRRLPWNTDLAVGFVTAVIAALLEAAVGAFLRLDSPVGLLAVLLLVLAAYQAAIRLF